MTAPKAVSYTHLDVYKRQSPYSKDYGQNDSEEAVTLAQKKKKEPTPRDLEKIRIAQSLGLGERLQAEGWGGLTARETGRIGALMSRKKL